jgi:uncharacterized damage-inducible protein DinB
VLPLSWGSLLTVGNRRADCPSALWRVGNPLQDGILSHLARNNRIMPVSAETLRLHLDYHAWASRRLLNAIDQLTPAELSRDFNTSDKNVLDTLAHVFGADRLWLARVTGESPTAFLAPEDRQREVLSKQWPALEQRWKDWAAPLSDQDFQAKIPYRDLKGNPYEQPLWQILLHVVNHGTHHRGQVSGFLRAMGHHPPPLDLIAFYREL